MGPTSKGRGREGREGEEKGKGRGGNGGKGRGSGSGREREKREPPTFLFKFMPLSADTRWCFAEYAMAHRPGAECTRGAL